MQTLLNYLFAALGRMQRFLNDNAAELPGVSASGSKQQLDDLVTLLGNTRQSQEDHTRLVAGAVATKAQLRKQLWEQHMKPVAAVARAQRKTNPALAGARLPRANASADTVKVTATSMANIVEPHAQDFVTAGLDTDFIQQLRTATDAFSSMDATRDDTTKLRVKDTIGMKVASREARSTVRVLDAMIRAKLPTDSVVLAHWEAVKAVVVSASTPVSTASTTPAPAPTPAPAVGATTSAAAPSHTSPPEVKTA